MVGLIHRNKIASNTYRYISIDDECANQYRIEESTQELLMGVGSMEAVDAFIKVCDVTNKEIITILPCSSPKYITLLAALKKIANRLIIITTKQIQEQVRMLGWHETFYILENNHWMFETNSGSKLSFFPTPFTPEVGSFVMLNNETKVLFSNELFSSNNASPINITLHLDSIQLYHKQTFPSGEFVRAAINKIKEKEFHTIAPSSGAIVVKENVEDTLQRITLQDFFNIEAYSSVVRETPYFDLCNQAIRKLLTVYKKEDIERVFLDSIFTLLPESMELYTERAFDYQDWNAFFDVIYNKKGIEWIVYLEPMVIKTSSIYNITRPTIYQSAIVHLSQEKEQAEQEKQQLEAQIYSLNLKLQETSNQLLRCPITNLYNETFFREFIKRSYANDEVEKTRNDGFLFLSVDQLAHINKKYGLDTGNQTLVNASYIMKQNCIEQDIIFKYVGATFIIMIPNATEKELFSKAEQIQNAISKSDSFIEKISLSVAIVTYEEMDIRDAVSERLERILSYGNARLQAARQQSSGTIVGKNVNIGVVFDGYALLIDEDEVNQNVILRIFERENYKVHVVTDVYEALEIIETKKIDLVMSEINISKLDGFALKQKLNESNAHRLIPYIILSHNKTTETIIRANSLNIDYVLQKPIYPEELLGLVQRFRKRREEL